MFLMNDLLAIASETYTKNSFLVGFWMERIQSLVGYEN